MPDFDSKDIAESRIVAALGYLLFALPLLLKPRSPFARFHANQSLLLLLVGLAGLAVLGFVPVIGTTLLRAWRTAWVVLMVLGVLTASQGRAQRLPFVGEVDIIK